MSGRVLCCVRKDVLSDIKRTGLGDKENSPQSSTEVCGPPLILNNNSYQKPICSMMCWLSVQVLSGGMYFLCIRLKPVYFPPLFVHLLCMPPLCMHLLRMPLLWRCFRRCMIFFSLSYICSICFCVRNLLNSL